jgi:hypothetical protein
MQGASNRPRSRGYQMYRTYRIFCAAPWELENERRAFYDVVGQFNEAEAMRHGVLFVPVSLVPNLRDKRAFQYDVEQNIRASHYYIQVLSSDWGPAERNFEADCRLAIQCAHDPQLPMANVAVFVKNTSSTSGISLPDDVARHQFSESGDFKAQLYPLLSDWLRLLREEAS